MQDINKDLVHKNQKISYKVVKSPFFSFFVDKKAGGGVIIIIV